jgi:hypothetical protein
MDVLKVVAFGGLIALVLILGVSMFRRSIAFVAEWTIVGAAAGLITGLIAGYLIEGRQGLAAGATVGGVIGGALGFVAIRRIADSD